MASAPATVASTTAPDRGLSWLLSATIALAGILVYANSLGGPFIFDDDAAIPSNVHIREWWHLADILSPQRGTPLSGRPLVTMSFAVNYAVGHLQTLGYHVVNIAIHVICGLLLFATVRRSLEWPRVRETVRGKSVNLAFAAALIWTIHPLNSEAVDYLVQRTESLMALFYLLTLYASARAVESNLARWKALAVCSCFAGMACKESMVTVPVMVLLYDTTLVYGSLALAWRERWGFYLSLASAWGFLALLLWSGARLEGGLSAGDFTTPVSVWVYLLNQATMIARYLRLSVWPSSLVSLYGLPVPLTLSDTWPYALLVGGLGVATIVALFRRPPLGFLGASVFVTLAPTSSVIRLTEVGAERRMYLPLMAIVVLATALASNLWSWGEQMLRSPAHKQTGTRKFAAAATLAMIATPLGAATLTRNREYASGLIMAQTVLARRPSSVAHYEMGSELVALGHRDEGVAEFRQAVATFPRAHFYLGQALFTEGKLDEAISELQTFIREDPLIVQVIRAHLLICGAYSTQQRWPEAIEQCRTVLAMTPANIDAQFLLADALSGEDKFDEAIPHYRAYLQSRPNEVPALTNFGVALATTGRMDEAIPVFREASNLEPQNARLRVNLARALFDHENFAGAADQAQRAVALDGNDLDARDLLSRSLARLRSAAQPGK
jgi:protein O-mannosyl-transferase